MKEVGPRMRNGVPAAETTSSALYHIMQRPGGIIGVSSHQKKSK